MACQTDGDGYSAAPPYRSDRAARLRKCPRGGHSRGERAPYGARAVRRGGRVAEGARLESVFTGNRNVGSNPTPSAKSLIRLSSQTFAALRKSVVPSGLIA